MGQTLKNHFGYMFGYLVTDVLVIFGNVAVMIVIEIIIVDLKVTNTEYPHTVYLSVMSRTLPVNIDLSKSMAIETCYQG